MVFLHRFNFSVYTEIGLKFSKFQNYISYALHVLRCCWFLCVLIPLQQVYIGITIELLFEIHRGSYMSAHVLLILLNELGKRDRMRGLPSILSLFFATSLINSIIQEHEC